MEIKFVDGLIQKFFNWLHFVEWWNQSLWEMAKNKIFFQILDYDFLEN